MDKNFVQILIEDFGLAETAELDPEGFELNSEDMNEDPNEELDVYFMKHAGVFAAQGYKPLISKDRTWRDYYLKVVAGIYPLEQIPVHVRDLAKQLYYDKEE